MAKPRYGCGIGWCKRGQHYVKFDDVRIGGGGMRYCKEHRFQIRSRPRAKKYKDKYYDRLKTIASQYPNT